MSNSENKGFLGWVERVGNKIPHPFILFTWLIVFILALSFAGGMAGISVINPTNQEEVFIRNMISGEGVNFALQNAVRNFTGFAPLGLVLTMTLGIGLAEKVGLMSTFMRKTILGASPKLITIMIMFIGINGNIASDAAIVIIPAISAMIFLSIGRNPLAGIALGFAATTAGFSANFFIAGTDALLSGITNEASAIVNAPEIPVTANWYFMIASTILLSIVGMLVNDRVVEPRLGVYQGSKEVVREEISKDENKALRAAGIGLLVFLVIMTILAFPQNSFLRNPDTGSLINRSPLLSGIIPILLIMFLSTSIPYGKSIGTIKNSGDVPKYMSEAIKDMSSFIVLAFIIGQFIAFFNWTNIGLVLAVSGANLLESTGFTGIPLFIGFILLCTFINLFIGSGSAKWALLAPIFVPMLALIGYHPAFTQILYRIGDSTTNIISPLFPYFPIVLAFMNDYDEEAGVGTLLSSMIPYSLFMLVAWGILCIIWFILGLPLGPGGYIFI